MTLTAVVVCLTLFAYACGFIVGVTVGQSWYEHRTDELALAEQAPWDEDEATPCSST